MDVHLGCLHGLQPKMLYNAWWFMNKISLYQEHNTKLKDIFNF